MENVTGELVKELQSQDKKLLVQCTASWCGPCKQLTPRLEGLESEYSNIMFVKVDVDTNGDYVSELGIRSVPTVLIYNGNETVGRLTGLNPDKSYKDILDLL